jgi:hypothetical protein
LQWGDLQAQALPDDSVDDFWGVAFIARHEQRIASDGDEVKHSPAGRTQVGPEAERDGAVGTRDHGSIWGFVLVSLWEGMESELGLGSIDRIRLALVQELQFDVA